MNRLGRLLAVLISVTPFSASAGPLPVDGPGGTGENALLSLLVSINDRTGRGLIVGRRGDKILIATAAHVVNESESWKVGFFDQTEQADAELLFTADKRASTVDDIAILAIPDRSGLDLSAACVAPADSERDRMNVWLYGRKWAKIGTSGKFKANFAPPAFVATGFDGVDWGDSGGAVLGPAGLVGLLINKTDKTEDENEKQRIGIVPIRQVQAAVEKKVAAGSWKLPDCAPRPFHASDPALCETQQSQSCWVTAAYEVFRSDPTHFDRRRRLAHGIARMGNEDYLARVLDSASVEERADILLDLLTMESGATKLTRAEQAAPAIEGIDDPMLRLERRARLVGELVRSGTQDALPALGQLVTEIAALPLIDQAQPLFQLSFYCGASAADCQKSVAGSLEQSLSARGDQGRYDVQSKLSQWASNTIYLEAPVTSAAIMFSRLRTLAAFKSTLNSDNKATRFYQFAQSPFQTLVSAYARAGDVTPATSFIESEALFWTVGESGISYALEALRVAREYEAAQQLLLAGLVYTDEPDFDREDVRYAGSVVRNLYDLATAAETDENFHRSTEPLFELARKFATDHTYRFQRDRLKDQFMGAAQFLCKHGEPTEAARYYVSAWTQLLTEMATQAIDPSTLFGRGAVDTDRMLQGSDYRLSATHAWSLGAELPLCIARAYDTMGGRGKEAKVFLDIAKQRMEGGSARYDAVTTEKYKADFPKLEPTEQAPFIVFLMETYAKDLFANLTVADMGYEYASSLLALGDIEPAQKAAGQYWENVSADDAKMPLFSALLRSGRTAEARALLGSTSYLWERFGIYREADPEQAFLHASAIAYARLGFIEKAADAVGRLVDADEQQIIQTQLVDEVAKRSSSELQGGQMDVLLGAFGKPSQHVLDRMLYSHLQRGDLIRAERVLRQLFAKPDFDEWYHVPLFAEAAIETGKLSGVASVIGLSRSVSRQGQAFLDLAKVF